MIQQPLSSYIAHPQSSTRIWRVTDSVLVLALLVAVSGCDNTIEPFSERGTYSMYGYLVPSQDQQFIRVKPLTIPVTKVDSHSVDATVTLENITEGTSEVLRDSIITYEDAESSVVTHNFVTKTPITLETKYRVVLEGPSGTHVRASTVTPTAKKAEPTPNAGNCLSTFTVLFKGVTDQRRIRATLEVKYEAHEQKDPWIEFPRDDIYTTTEGNVIVEFTPSEFLEGEVPQGSLPPNYNPFCWYAPRCLRLDSNEIRINYAYLGPKWYGDIPPDSLTYDPLRSHDVSNGLGFLGSLRRDRAYVRVDTSSLIASDSPFCN